METTNNHYSRKLINDLTALADIVPNLQTEEPCRDTQIAPSDGHCLNPRNSPSNTVTIFPGDPSFDIEDSLPKKIWPMLYMQQHRWLPSYGPWYIQFTSAAMQRRHFPRELRGQANFQNSMSLKLLTTVSDVINRISLDFYSDLRNITDTMSGLCLISAYYSIKTNSPPPTSLAELTANLSRKIYLIIKDLRKKNGNFSFFFHVDPRSTLSLAPSNQNTMYAPTFFDRHIIYSLFNDVNMFSTSRSTQEVGRDMVLTITQALFGENVPPFSSYQWNLRTGIKCVEQFLLMYMLLENQFTLPATGNRRLHLDTLLGETFKNNISRQLHPEIASASPDYLFSFLMDNYFIPSIMKYPNLSMSALFPGIFLAALEASNPTSLNSIHLNESRFKDIFNIIMQTNVLQNAQELIYHRSSLRIACENGTANILSTISPSTTLKDILRTQFMAATPYDFVYFLVLGALPVTVAVV